MLISVTFFLNINQGLSGFNKVCDYIT